MRFAFILALGTLVASGAQACIPNSGRYLYNDPHEGPSHSLECLYRESDGRKLCRTPAEWRATLVPGLATKSDGKQVYYTSAEWREIRRSMGKNGLFQ